jgi:DUF4097 and DUF4098 domain-containing protein YvlB
MKKLLFAAMAVICICLAFSSVSAQQEFKTKSTREFTMTTGTVAIYTFNGNVKVEGYSGSKVLFEVEEVITASNQNDLEKGKKEVQFTFEQKSDSLKAYTITPRDSRPFISSELTIASLPYSYAIHYTVKVPEALDLEIVTINGETLSVSNLSGKLNLRNIRGAISIINAKGAIDARTVRGALTATLKEMPQAAFFKTISGEIKIRCPEGLSADIRLNTQRGNFYTDFAKNETLPVQFNKSVDDKSELKTYKTDIGIRIGNGGRELRFETMTGDIYVQKL